MSDEPLGDDSKPRSYDVTFSNPLLDLNDNYTLCYDNPLFDEEFEDISSMDPPKSAPLNYEPLNNPNSVSRSLKTSDLILEELTAEIGLAIQFQLKLMMGGKMRVIEDPSFDFHHMPSPHPAAYSLNEVMYCYYHPHLTSGDGFDPESKNFPMIVKTIVLVFNPPITRSPIIFMFISREIFYPGAKLPHRNPKATNSLAT
ncbi:hypothetical protein Tco_0751099 [Tanacetum coccineum]|uniref:NAC domain-containing protein n=1 Tax=Tanacetum coccineum TaxID=301880 RepID=A0ABQ4Z6K1_9ASTR